MNPGLPRGHHRAGLGPPLVQLLEGTPASELAETCRRLDVKPGRSRAENLVALAGCVADPSRARRILEKAPPGAAEIAREAAAGAHVQVRGSVFYLDDRTAAGGWPAGASWRGRVGPAGDARRGRPGPAGAATPSPTSPPPPPRSRQC